MPRFWYVLLLLLSLAKLSPRLFAARPGLTRLQYEAGGPLQREEVEKGLHMSSASINAPDFLADFAGKKRLWVITAPSHNDDYLRMMEKQIQDAESEGLNCRLAERDTLIVTIIQNAMMEGKIQRTTFQGESTTESLEPDTVSKLLHYLELEEQTFSMLVLKKNLRVSERFPYPVRVEAVLEVIDQLPVQKLEKITRKGSPQKCKTKKKVLAKRKGSGVKKRVFSLQRQSNVTAILPVGRRPLLDKKAALKSRVQDILSGRFRFVIRKAPTSPDLKGDTLSPSERAGGKENRRTGEGLQKSRNPIAGARIEQKEHEVAKDQKKEGEKSGGKREEGSREKKGKPKGKKGKGKGSKKNRDTKEKKELKVELLDFSKNLQGKRRLLLITSPSASTPLYGQQREENELHYCDLATRRVTMATILSTGPEATLTLQHYQLASEPPLTSLPDKFTDPYLISQMREEYGLSSSGFSVTMIDYDLKPSNVFTSPTSSSVLMDYIDSFPSRRIEREREKKTPVKCSRPELAQDKNSLQSFMSKRRLLIVSSPTEDDYSFQQQLQAFNGQSCQMGVRHFALLRLVGSGVAASGTVELFPLNGKSQSEVEPLSPEQVTELRDRLKISREFFSMLVVGKDSDVKAWFPSPMWSLSSVYDLVDSMELRQQEEKLQRTLGIHCPDEANRGGIQDYDDSEDVESYLYHRPSED